MGLPDLVVTFIKLIIPPRPEDHEGQIRWRWVVFIGLVSVGAGLAIHISLAEGVFPQVFSGYALETETQSIQKRVDVIATLSLEHEMREKASELCRERDGDVFHKAELNDDISKLQREYWDVNHRYYMIPECSQL